MTDHSDERVGLDSQEQRAVVRDRYGDIATGSTSCCGEPSPATDSASCCDGRDAAAAARDHGYTDDDIAAASDANLGLGCGNPTAIASLDTGDTVLDLGSGGGFDCFLAAREVGPDGHVIGVDMTPEMLETARGNRESNDVDTVEFRLGEIEHLPVADATVDVVLSNCVVNLSPEKAQVFQEAVRVLRPGGRLAISDVVRTAEFPPGLTADPDSVAGCVAGAASVPTLERYLDDAGFTDITIEPKSANASFIADWDAALDLDEFLVAATIEATKPPID